jgi:hypothetical protein
MPVRGCLHPAARALTIGTFRDRNLSPFDRVAVPTELRSAVPAPEWTCGWQCETTTTGTGSPPSSLASRPTPPPCSPAMSPSLILTARRSSRSTGCCRSTVTPTIPRCSRPPYAQRYRPEGSIEQPLGRTAATRAASGRSNGTEGERRPTGRRTGHGPHVPEIKVGSWLSPPVVGSTHRPTGVSRPGELTRDSRVAMCPRPSRQVDSTTRSPTPGNNTPTAHGRWSFGEDGPSLHPIANVRQPALEDTRNGLRPLGLWAQLFPILNKGRGSRRRRDRGRKWLRRPARVSQLMSGLKINPGHVIERTDTNTTGPTQCPRQRL